MKRASARELPGCRRPPVVLTPFVLPILLPVVLLLALIDAPAGAQCEVQKVRASDPGGDAWFGYDVAAQSGRVAIGARSATTDAGAEAGAVYVYDTIGGATAMVEVVRLVAPDGAAGDRFGAAVDTDGVTLVVGAPYADRPGLADTGAVYVYRRENGAWVEQGRLVPRTGGAGQQFGADVSVLGTRIAVGAPRHPAPPEDARGAVFVYERQPDNAWLEVAQLAPADLVSPDAFGASVSVNAARLIASSPQDDDLGADSGAVYVFERDAGGTWSETAKLLAPDGEAADQFGGAVGLDGDLVALGVENDDDAGIDAGAVHVFEYFPTPDVWHHVIKLTSDVGSAGARLGRGVDIEGHRILAGARQATSAGGEIGSAHVFEGFGGTWIEAAVLTPSDGRPLDRFGRGCALDGPRIVAGAYWSDDGGPDAGAAYLFRLDMLPDCNGNGLHDLCDIHAGTALDCDGNGVPDECQAPPVACPCTADLDGSFAVDVGDLVMLVLAWGSADPLLDLDGSGLVDVGDLVELILAWGDCA